MQGIPQCGALGWSALVIALGGCPSFQSVGGAGTGDTTGGGASEASVGGAESTGAPGSTDGGGEGGSTMAAVDDTAATSVDGADDTTTGTDSETGAGSTGRPASCGGAQALCHGDVEFTAYGCMVPSGIALEDFDADGNLDAIVVCRSSDTVAVLLGDGAGGWTVGSVHATAGDDPDSLVHTDLDADGLPDVAVVNTGSDTVGVFIRDGATGLPETATTYFMGGDAEAVGMAAGHVDDDEHVDLVVAANYTGNLRLFLGEGAGVFAQETVMSTPGSANRDVVALPIDDDATVDIAWSSHNNDVYVHTGFGDGSFADGVEETAANGLRGLLAADLLGDGRVDLMAISGANDQISYFEGEPGGFVDAVGIPCGNYPRAVVIDDVDLDGALDFVVANGNSAQVSVLLGDGAGGFATTTFDTGPDTDPRRVATGDINNDGIPDIAFVQDDQIGLILSEPE